MTTVHVFEPISGSGSSGILNYPLEGSNHSVWVKLVLPISQSVSGDELDSLLAPFCTLKLKRWVRKTLHTCRESCPEDAACPAHSTTPRASEKASKKRKGSQEITEDDPQEPSKRLRITSYHVDRANTEATESVETVETVEAVETVKAVEAADATKALYQLRTKLGKVIHRDLRNIKTSEIDQLKTEAENVKTTTKEEKEYQKGLISDINYNKTLASFLKTVARGAKKLAEEEPSGLNDNNSLFAKMVGFRNSPSNNIMDAFEGGLSRSLEIGKQEKFRVAMLSEAGRITQRHMTGSTNSQFSSATHERQESDEKRHEKKSEILYSLVDKLYALIGANAWGLHAVLLSKSCLCHDLVRLSKSEKEKFVGDAVPWLLECELARIPDTAAVLHAPAVISWLIRRPFAEVCNHLGLSGGAAENPGIKQELDTLEEQHQNGGITEHQSRRAMLVSMGDLRNICERWKNREVLIEPNATAETTVTGQHSPSGLLDKGLNAVGSLRPDPQPRQSSAHTSPIQDNLSDEAHLESSNGFDPSIDHQEGALSTVITDVIPLDTQSHQASHHEYQEQEQTESGLPVSCNLHGYSDDLLSSDIQSYMDFFHPASPGEFDWNEQPVDINVLTS